MLSLGTPMCGNLCVCVPSFVIGLAGRMLLTVFDINDLKKAGLEALVALMSMGMLKGDNPKVLDKFPKKTIEIGNGCSAFLPCTGLRAPKQKNSE